MHTVLHNAYKDGFFVPFYKFLTKWWICDLQLRENFFDLYFQKVVNEPFSSSLSLMMNLDKVDFPASSSLTYFGIKSCFIL